MPLNKVYQSQDAAIASYNAQDIIAGTGLATLYAARCSGSNILSDKVFNADPNTYFVHSGGILGAFTLKGDEDYDALFARPTEVKGDAIISLTSGAGSDGSTSTNYDYILAELVHIDVDGSTTTSLGTGTSTQYTCSVGTTGQNSKIRAMKITIARTHFKIGDSLRLTIKHYCKSSAGTYFGWGTDPGDNNDAGVDTSGKVIQDADPTTLILYLPIIVDL